MIRNTLSPLFTLLFLLSIIYSKADSIEVSGLVSGTWNVDTVRVVGNIEVREVATLEINPGVMILFTGEYFLKVNGSLKALGNEEFPIRFTMADTTGFFNDTLPFGGWKQIRIENINQGVDSTIFNYCHFEYGKAVNADSVHGYGGALCIRNSDRIKIENCVFTHNFAYYNGGAVFLENADILVRNNTFENNSCGLAFAYYGYGGGLCTDWGEPLIEKNIFHQNSSTGIGGGLCVRFNDCMVLHNVFDDNFSALGGGLGMLHIDTCRNVISNNLVINNGANFFGAGISNGDCSPTYVNNTICDNHCGGGGGGFYCKDSVVPNLYNNILYGNTQFGGEVNQVYLWDLLSQPNFYFNNVEGGSESFYGTGGTAYSGEYENNIDEFPLFELEAYTLESQSPCVNSGTWDTTGLMIPAKDLAGNARFVGDCIDMGAYENQNPVAVGDQQVMSQLVFYPPSPNPVADKVTLSFYLPNMQNCSVRIIDAHGKTVSQVYGGVLQTGKHSYNWNVDRNVIAAGIYFCVLEFDNRQMEQKIIVSR